MDPIDQELRSRYQWDGAFLRPDPAAIVQGTSPAKARWTVWAHGAAGLLAKDKQRAGIWLQHCVELMDQEEHRADLLWCAEVFSALGELSLIDGEYFDALRRSQHACLRWRNIDLYLRMSNQPPTKRARAADETFLGPKEYVDGVASEVILRGREVNLGALGATRQLILQRAIGRFLFCVEIALNANEAAGQYDRDLVRTAQQFLDAHTDVISKEALYRIFNAFGNQASAADEITESLEWFSRAVELYYQNCEDENDLYRLVTAMFNRANALARLGKYDEALGIYHMISGDFERVGNYEAELRVDYAILHTRYRKGERQGVEDGLRELVSAYQGLIQEAASERDRIDTRNLDVVKSLLLTVIASKPSSVESFLEAMTLATKGIAQAGDNVVKRYGERQAGTFTNWREVGSVELLDAFLKPHPDSMLLMFDTGVERLLTFALQGGGAPLADRCHCAALSEEFATAFSQLLLATREENDRIIQRRKAARDPVTERLPQLGEEVWKHLPIEVRNMIASCERLFIVLSPFGNISEFPVELIKTGAGWLGLTHAICHANSVESLVRSLADNPTPRQVDNRAVVVRAGDPRGMEPLRSAQQEAEDVVRFAKFLGAESEGPVTLEPEQLIKELAAGHHLFHYVGHGSANVLGEKLLLSEDRWLPSPWLRSIVAHRAPIAFLSACEMGRARLAAGNAKGFVLEMLNSGSPGVIAATRPVSDRVSGDIVREIYAASMHHNLPEALRAARRNLDAERMNPVCWSAYIYYGRPHTALRPNPFESREPGWHQLLTRFLASGAEEHRDRAVQALLGIAGSDSSLREIETLLSGTADDGFLDADRLVSDLAAHDLVGALRLRAYLGALRVERALKEKKFEEEYLLNEIGTSLGIGLRIWDSFALVGAARRHCQLPGVVALEEITKVLDHAVQLADSMAAHDPLFKPAFEELARENQIYGGRVVMDLTKVLPQRMLDQV